MSSLDQIFRFFALAQTGNPMNDHNHPHDDGLSVDSLFQSDVEAFSTVQEIARILEADALIPPTILLPVRQTHQYHQHYHGSLPESELFDPLRRKTYMDPRYQEFIDDYDRIFGNGTMKL